MLRHISWGPPASPNWITCVWGEGTRCGRDRAESDHIISFTSWTHMKTTCQHFVTEESHVTNFDQCNVAARDTYYFQSWLGKYSHVLTRRFPCHGHGPRSPEQKKPAFLHYGMEQSVPEESPNQQRLHWILKTKLLLCKATRMCCSSWNLTWITLSICTSQGLLCYIDLTLDFLGFKAREFSMDVRVVIRNFIKDMKFKMA